MHTKSTALGNEGKIAAIGAGLGIFFGVLIPDLPGALLSGFSGAVAGSYITSKNQHQLTEKEIRQWLEGYRQQSKYDLYLDSKIQQVLGDENGKRPS